MRLRILAASIWPWRSISRGLRQRAADGGADRAGHRARAKDELDSAPRGSAHPAGARAAARRRAAAASESEEEEEAAPRLRPRPRRRRTWAYSPAIPIPGPAAARRWRSDAWGLRKEGRCCSRSLADSDPDVRQMAALGLGLLADKTAVPALTTALQDASPAVRGRAAEALGLIGDAASAPAVGEMVSALVKNGAIAVHGARRGAVAEEPGGGRRAPRTVRPRAAEGVRAAGRGGAGRVGQGLGLVAGRVRVVADRTIRVRFRRCSSWRGRPAATRGRSPRAASARSRTPRRRRCCARCWSRRRETPRSRSPSSTRSGRSARPRGRRRFSPC